MNVMLTRLELIVTIAVIALGTMLTRFSPLLMFPRKRKIPMFIKRLQVFLPGAAIGLLVVYCFRHLDLLAGNRGLPEILATIGVVFLYRSFKNALLSIGGGTALYMFLIQKIF